MIKNLNEEISFDGHPFENNNMKKSDKAVNNHQKLI